MRGMGAIVSAVAAGVLTMSAGAEPDSPALRQKLASMGDVPVVVADEGRGSSQDFCPGVSVFTCAGFAFMNTAAATTSAGDPNFACAFGGPRQGTGTVWARIIPVTTSITITTSYPNPTLPNGRLPDTLLAVYTGSCGALNQIACNDDIDFASGNLLSTITLNGLTSGQTYFIEIAAFSNLDVATYTLTVSGCLLPNWICEGADPIDCNQTVLADLRRSSTFVNSPLFPCRINGPTRGEMPLWYRFTASTPNVRLLTSDADLADSANDTLLAVYTGECGSLTQVACDDDSGPGFFSTILLSGLTIGQQYYVEVAGYDSSDVGRYNLHMECQCDGECPPGSYIEQEACGQDTNSACWNGSPGFEAVELGQVICGRTGRFQIDAEAGLGNFDYDIYEFVISRPSMVYWLTRSDQRLGVTDSAILTAGCTGMPIAFPDFGAEPCHTLGIARFLSNPGAYQGGFAPDSVACSSLGGRYLACATIGPACRGDADGDGDVDFGDVVEVLTFFGTDYNPFPGIGLGDANFNGEVAFGDITTVLENFGTECFGARPDPAAIEPPEGSPWAR